MSIKNDTPGTNVFIVVSENFKRKRKNYSGIGCFYNMSHILAKTFFINAILNFFQISRKKTAFPLSNRLPSLFIALFMGWAFRKMMKIVARGCREVPLENIR